MYKQRSERSEVADLSTQDASPGIKTSKGKTPLENEGKFEFPSRYSLKHLKLKKGCRKLLKMADINFASAEETHLLSMANSSRRCRVEYSHATSRRQSKSHDQGQLSPRVFASNKKDPVNNELVLAVSNPD